MFLYFVRMALIPRALSRRAAALNTLALVPQRNFTSRRVDRRGTAVMLRRADISEEALEREVRKGLDKEGDYTGGEVSTHLFVPLPSSSSPTRLNCVCCRT